MQSTLRVHTSRVALATVLSAFTLNAIAADSSPPNTLTDYEKKAGWILLFDGRTLAGWKASENGESFTVREGMIVARALGTPIENEAPHPKSHLFFVGADGQADFDNFEFQCDVKCAHHANSGIYFHTQFLENAWPQQGFEIQIDNDPAHPKQSGSLYGVADVADSAARDDEWFHMHVIVCGKRVVITIDGKTVVDWTEPDGFVARQPPWYAERKLSHGTLALQAHDSDSCVSFKALKVRPLDTWEPLFNGRDLTGWTPKIKGHELGDNFANTFRVEDGVLRVSYDGYKQFGEKFGHLFYRSAFSHYVLRVEYRFVGEQCPGGPAWAWRNSGVMVHSERPEGMPREQAFPVSIEAQFLGGDGSQPRPTGNLCTPGTHVVMDGNLITRHCTSSRSKTYHGDQWVVSELEVHGNDRIIHRINGETVLEYERPQLDPNDRDSQKLIENGRLMLDGGYIALQSESHPIEFQRVEIRRLPAEPAKETGSSCISPLRVHPTNPRYFTDGTKLAGGSLKAVYLCGSHTWNNLVDMGRDDPPKPFDFNAYLDFLVQHNHNFIRLWAWDSSTLDTRGYHGQGKDFVHYAGPQPWLRTGPEAALDGKPRFNLTKLNPEYFDRLRARVRAAGERGIYVSVMLFEGWGMMHGSRGPKPAPEGWPWRSHPFHRDNNINGINGDADGDDRTGDVHTRKFPEVNAIQAAYIRKVVDTLNDLDNVLYEVVNEGGQKEWDWWVVQTVREHEQTKSKQHPIGLTGHGAERLDSMLASEADWVSPGRLDGYAEDPPAWAGKKVSLLDTDHIWGMGGNADWVWRAFTRGHNLLFMDQYQGSVFDAPDRHSQWEDLRRALGQTRRLAERMNLAAMTPDNALASTTYCLSNPGTEYLVYQPEKGKFTVDLTKATGDFSVKWLDPITDKTTTGEAIPGGAVREFTPPADGPVVLHLTRRETQTAPIPERRTDE
jgi:hypothetical protein